MDRLLTILAIAQSGLATGARLLTQRAKAQTTAADKETDAAKKAALLQQAKRSTTLAKALTAADKGIEAYLEEE